MRGRRIAAIAGAAVLLPLAAFCLWIALPLPSGLLSQAADPALILLDRNGRELRTTRAEDGSRRRWTALSEIDPDLVAAFLAAEDRRFYRHPGVDPRAVVRAAWSNLRAGEIV